MNEYMPEDMVLQFSLDICSGVSAVHKKKIIHRDLKPENILIKEGRLKLADFGIAKKLFTDATKATTNAWNISYQAPEMLADSESETYG